MPLAYSLMEHVMAEPWVSVEQIAEHLGVTRDSIYRWIDRKGLPAHRVGRLWKFKASEVDDWVRAGGANDAEQQLAAPSVPRTRTNA
jgi:excisionase family DNA binding protein